MARFFDAMNMAELSRVERTLQRGGIAYSLRAAEEGSGVREIQVAEEDVAQAECLLAGTKGETGLRRRQTTR